MAAPSIVWKKVTSDGTTVTQGDFSTVNTVNHDAIQAGHYSKVVCLRPTAEDGGAAYDFVNDGHIGNIRFWWYEYNGTNNGTSYSMPENDWVMKYYISMCNETVAGVTVTDSKEGCANMIDIFTTEANITNVTQSKTLTTTYTDYCKSTWDSSSTYYCLQPIPFFINGKTALTEQAQYKTFYGNDWNNIGVVYDIDLSGTTDGALLDIAVGNGEEYNMVQEVASNNDFPYVFLTIKPPSDAPAGNWSGFQHRISYVWPYST